MSLPFSLPKKLLTLGIVPQGTQVADEAPETASLRTLGNGPRQAAPGWSSKWVSVAKHGAVGGSALDRPAIQAAIAEAGPTGRVFFPKTAQPYRIDEPISVTQHWMSFFGEGMETSVLKADAGVPIFTVPGGEGQIGRHGIVFEHMGFKGDAGTLSSYMFAPPSKSAYFGFGNRWRDCKFGDLAGVFDLAGGQVEMTGVRFESCEFENAPCHLKSTGIGNFLNWSRCRFSANNQGVPACWIEEENASSSATNVVFNHCDFEGNDHIALKCKHVHGLSMISPYFEQNAWAAAGAIPVIDLAYVAKWALREPYAYLTDGQFFVSTLDERTNNWGGTIHTPMFTGNGAGDLAALDMPIIPGLEVFGGFEADPLVACTATHWFAHNFKTGFFLNAPNGDVYKIGVDNAGALTLVKQ